MANTTASLALVKLRASCFNSTFPIGVGVKRTCFFDVCTQVSIPLNGTSWRLGMHVIGFDIMDPATQPRCVADSTPKGLRFSRQKDPMVIIIIRCS